MSSNGVNGNSQPQVKASTKLRQLLAAPGCLQAPGVYDGITARLCIEAGFKAMYQSGAVVTASRLGLPDIAFAGLRDYTDIGSVIANIDPSVPLIADADTGFGGPNAIARMVQQYDRMGIAGFHMEDQVQMKRCGHLKGKKVVDLETWKTRLRAAVAARAAIPGGSDIVIIARTDALAVEGFDSALERLKAAKEIGADIAFLEAVNKEDQLKTVIKTLSPMPCMVNLVPNGQTPHWNIKDLSAWGVKLAIYPLMSVLPAIQAVRGAYASLAKTGTEEHTSGGLTPRDLFEIMGLKHEEEIDRAAGGKHFAIDA